ncbi:MAG: chalcone isomerase family protein [Campylobacterales bacterium]|nr:chalcone isomerase family protein [Campylobacterales bacterium]
MGRIFLIFVFVTAVFSKEVCFENSCYIKKRMTFYGLSIYNLEYYLDKKRNEKIIIEYLRDIKKEKNIEKSDKWFRKTNRNISQNTEKNLATLHSYIVDVKLGDKFIIEVNDKKTLLSFNQKILGKIANGQFGRKYFNIWTGGEDILDEDLAKYIKNIREKMDY